MMDELTVVHVALAKEALNSFEVRGERWFTRGAEPEWVTDIVREAHGALLPNDWTYGAVVACLATVAEAGPGADAWELCVEPDIYNRDLVDWFSSSLQRAAFCDEACEEGLVAEDADMWDRIRAGQSRELSEVMVAVLNGLSNRADEIAEQVAEAALS